MAIKTKGKSTTSVSSWWEDRRKVLASNTKPARAKPKSAKGKPIPVRAKPKTVIAKSKPVRAKPKTVKAKSKSVRAKPKTVSTKPAAKARTASKKKIVKTVSKAGKSTLAKKAKKR